jgi:hypothetical protein
MNMRHAQRGFSFIGFVMLAVVLGAVFLLVARSIPAHNEFFAVKRVLQDVAKEVGGGGTKPQYSAAFDRRTDIDGIESVKGADIRVSKAAEGTVLTLEYEKRQPLVSYVSLVFEFSATASAK